MDTNKILGWLFLLYGAWSLASGVLTNNMGGLASIGYNPDRPMSFGDAPFRFLLGIAVYGVIIYYGWKLVSGTATLRGKSE